MATQTLVSLQLSCALFPPLKSLTWRRKTEHAPCVSCFSSPPLIPTARRLFLSSTIWRMPDQTTFSSRSRTSLPSSSSSVHAQKNVDGELEAEPESIFPPEYRPLIAQCCFAGYTVLVPVLFPGQYVQTPLTLSLSKGLCVATGLLWISTMFLLTVRWGYPWMKKKYWTRKKKERSEVGEDKAGRSYYLNDGWLGWGEGCSYYLKDGWMGWGKGWGHL